MISSTIIVTFDYMYRQYIIERNNKYTTKIRRD